jgi:hypothetical protein
VLCGRRKVVAGARRRRHTGAVPSIMISYCFTRTASTILGDFRKRFFDVAQRILDDGTSQSWNVTGGALFGGIIGHTDGYVISLRRSRPPFLECQRRRMGFTGGDSIGQLRFRGEAGIRRGSRLLKVREGFWWLRGGRDCGSGSGSGRRSGFFRSGGHVRGRRIRRKRGGSGNYCRGVVQSYFCWCSVNFPTQLAMSPPICPIHVFPQAV